MGPVSPLPGDAAKVFASAYALYSGLVLLITVAILVAPLLHRIMHRMHLEDDRGPRGGA
jgi:fumarate reductase subunit D